MTDRKRNHARELADAFDIHAEWLADSTRCSESELLARHPVLQELLEPLLSGADQPATVPDKILGDYRLLHEIGRGGMGVVYLARHESLGRNVALKVLPPQLTTTEVSVARFKREAQLAAQLDHPGIVKVLANGQAGEVYHFAMEYVRGAPLQDVVRDAKSTGIDTVSGQTVGTTVQHSEDQAAGPSRSTTEIGDWSRGYVETVVGITAQVADALHHAHEHGVIHRDVKPANILIRGDGQALLTDFGIARRDDLPSLTMPGDFAGTPHYISPEQAMAKRATVDRRTDIFSLGVTLYELVCLQLPFDGETNREVLDKIIGKEPADPCRVNRRLAPDLGAIILKAIEKDVDRRYATAAEFAADLRAFLDYRPVQARRAPVSTRVVRWARREPWKAALAATVLVATLIVASSTIYFGKELLAANLKAAAEEAKATELLAQYQLLENVVGLDSAIQTQTALYPAWPEVEPTLRAWLKDQAEPLAGKLPELRRSLQELRQQAQAYTAVDRAADRRAHPRWHEHQVAVHQLEVVRQMIADWERQGKPETAKQFRAAETFTAGKLRELEQLVDVRRTWRFTDHGVQFLHDRLAKLVTSLEEFVGDDERGLVADVRKRLAWAESVRRISVDAERGRWDAAIAGIQQSPRYHGLKIEPQIGLVPLSVNPQSGLWEFLHLRFHADDTPHPTRDPQTGRLGLEDGTGLVFVLVPGGTATIGAQSEDRTAPYYSEHAERDEKPPHPVTLSPFFLSKYEMTQGQWMRMTNGPNPSLNKPGRVKDHIITLRNPVETVSHRTAREALQRHGLALPTESQWECACRAGTTTPWSTGSDSRSLRGHANILDLMAQKHLAWQEVEEWLDDGHALTAPVGTYAANGWGFHDMHGNLWEWCADLFFTNSYDYPVRPGDGLGMELLGHTNVYVCRGGCHINPTRNVRSSERFGSNQSSRQRYLGLRPARSLYPK